MILRVTISRLRPHVHAAVLEPVRDQDDEVRLTLADRGLDRARVGLPVPEGLALEVLAAVVEELAQRGVPIRSDAVDRRLHRTAVFIVATSVPICATIAPPPWPCVPLFVNCMTPNRTPVTLSNRFSMTRLAMPILALGQVRPTQPAY